MKSIKAEDRQRNLSLPWLQLPVQQPSSINFFQWFFQLIQGPGLFFSSVIIFTQTVGLLGRVINPSQGRYLNTEQHKHRINAHKDIHALSGIRTHDPSVQASEDSSWLRPHGYCDRPRSISTGSNKSTLASSFASQKIWIMLFSYLPDFCVLLYYSTSQRIKYPNNTECINYVFF
jgi:hypothetical protein